MPFLCKSCKAPVRWVLMANNRRGPLDREPNPDGNVLIVKGRGVVATGAELQRARDEQEPLYMSHFATCPFADSHREGK